MGKLLIGWDEVDITPENPVCLRGQFYARISEKINDPITSTILVIEAIEENKKSEYVIWISCDLVAIPSEFKNGVIKEIKKIIPEINSERIIINATHTHTAPECGNDEVMGGAFGEKYKSIEEKVGVKLPCLEPVDYIKFASEKIAKGIKKAWDNRKEGGISYGLGFAVVGRNRRISYYDGTSKMYGKTDDPNFSHIEGYEDHSINIMATWNKNKKLTGLVVNIACPSQVSEHEFFISADFWHETRNELKKRFGKDIFVLAQCSSAGDQSPHILINKLAEERMWKLKEKSKREEIANRIVNGIEEILPCIKREINFEPEFKYIKKRVKLLRYKITEEEVNEYCKEAEKYYKEYELLKNEIEKNPEKMKQPRWYTNITSYYSKFNWYNRVKERYEIQKTNPEIEIEIHILRLGDIVFATNPFELYLDYGLRIKARSKAIQTFVVQLTGGGTYLPTERAIKGKSYGAIAPSCIVGPDGGKQLVEETLKYIEELFK